jgi:hypothetical protein
MQRLPVAVLKDAIFGVLRSSYFWRSAASFLLLKLPDLPANQKALQIYEGNPS